MPVGSNRNLSALSGGALEERAGNGRVLLEPKRVRFFESVPARPRGMRACRPVGSNRNLSAFLLTRPNS